MGLLENFDQQLGGNQQNALLQAVAGLISNSGGLSGLISRFTQNGLGQPAQSWVGSGENLAITGDQVRQVFGSDQVQQVAQQLGTDHAQTSNLIAGVLPNLVDRLTPQGQVVNDADAQQGISNLLSQGLRSVLRA